MINFVTGGWKFTKHYEHAKNNTKLAFFEHQEHPPSNCFKEIPKPCLDLLEITVATSSMYSWAKFHFLIGLVLYGSSPKKYFKNI